MVVKSSGKYLTPGEELATQILTISATNAQKVKNGEIKNVLKETPEFRKELDKKFNNLDDKEKNKFFDFLKNNQSQIKEILRPFIFKKVDILYIFKNIETVVIAPCEECPEKNICKKPWKR